MKHNLATDGKNLSRINRNLYNETDTNIKKIFEQ